MTIKRVAVLGAGLAGARTASELRQLGFTGHIAIIGAEPHEPYDRPPLSKQLFTRHTPAFLRDELALAIAQIADEVHLGTTVTQVARRGEKWQIEARTIDAPSPITIEADAVVVATGAHAVLPQPWAGALTLHTAHDADRLREALPAGGHLLIIGAGWIGAEISSGAVANGYRATVVEAAPAPLISALGETVGALTATWYAEAGVELLTNSTVAAASAREVTLASGRVLAADAVLAAVGVRPHTEFLTASGVELSVSGHVVVGADQRTTAPGVWAVGDCTVRTAPPHGQVLGGHWDAALTDPARAAASMLGAPVPPAPAPYVFSTQFGRELALVGAPQHATRWVARGDVTAGSNWGVLWFDAADRLVAVFAVDRPRDVIDARKLLANGPRALTEAVATDPGRRLREAA